jgi:endoglucanase
LHNFGRYYERPLSQNDADPLADVWRKLAKECKDNPGLYGYELMNEPHDLPGGSDTWGGLAQHVMIAIRGVDTEHAILVPGYNWQNAQDWTKNNQHLIIKDPSNNIIYTSHMYFDSSRKGAYKRSFEEDHGDVNIGVTGSEDFRNWLQQHHVRGMFTEFGVPPDQSWLDTMDHFLAAIDRDPNIVGAVYWSAGPWWGDYPLSIEPKDGKDRPQMRTFEKFIIYNF